MAFMTLDWVAPAYEMKAGQASRFLRTMLPPLISGAPVLIHNPNDTPLTVFGAAYDRKKPKRAVKFFFPPENVAATVGGIGISATRDPITKAAIGNVTITFGTAAGQVLDPFPTHSGTSDILRMVVAVNGVVIYRTNDGYATPSAGPTRGWSLQTSNSILCGASATYPIGPGTEIEVLLSEYDGPLVGIDPVADTTTTVVIPAYSTAVRYLGMSKTEYDTAGRQVTQLIEADVIVTNSDCTVTAL